MTKDRLLELRKRYPRNIDYFAAVERENAAERPAIPEPIEVVQPIIPKDGDAEYIAAVQAKLPSWLPGDASVGPSDLLPYFNGHLPRFQAQLAFWHLMEDEGIIPESVYDLGTPFPFTSWYWALRHASRVTFGCLGKYRDLGERSKNVEINLCDMPALPAAELVIATEVLEHLPCDLHAVADWLFSLVEHRGCLLLSFPLNGANARYYNRDLPLPRAVSHGHLREFTMETSSVFVERLCQLDAEIFADRTVFTSAYGGYIRNVLIRRIH